MEYANVADAIVAVSSDGGLWIVDPAADGVTRTPVPALDRTTRLADVELSGAGAERLAQSSPEVVAALLDRGAVLAADDLAGIAREALTRTVAVRQGPGAVRRSRSGRSRHSSTRSPTCASPSRWPSTPRSTPRTRWTPSSRTRRSPCRVAKAKASDTARDVTAAMIQFHGGIGYTWEHDAHFYFKRAKRLEYAYGDASEHRERIAVAHHRRLIHRRLPVEPTTVRAMSSPRRVRRWLSRCSSSGIATRRLVSSAVRACEAVNG